MRRFHDKDWIGPYSPVWGPVKFRIEGGKTTVTACIFKRGQVGYMTSKCAFLHCHLTYALFSVLSILRVQKDLCYC